MARKRALISFERLAPGHYWATHAGKAYAIRRRDGWYIAHAYENEDTPYGEVIGEFPSLAPAKICVQRAAGVTP